MSNFSNQVPTKQIKVGACFFCDPDLAQIKAVVGIGNPEPQFSKTRHNAGFEVINSLSRELGFDLVEKELCFQADFISKKGRKLGFYKPKTYMNNSGKIFSVLSKKGIKPNEVLVIHDELEKPLEYLFIRFSGGARGHNGLRSIIAVAGNDFWRLGFGIGRPDGEMAVGDFVIERFSGSELETVEKMIKRVDDYFNCPH